MEYSKRQKAIILYLSNRQKLSAMEVPGKQIADHLQISLRTWMERTLFCLDRKYDLPKKILKRW